ncbi:hypothetical protein TorRG33x02_162310, partial [Trema orientale]
SPFWHPYDQNPQRTRNSKTKTTTSLPTVKNRNTPQETPRETHSRVQDNLKSNQNKNNHKQKKINKPLLPLFEQEGGQKQTCEEKKRAKKMQAWKTFGLAWEAWLHLICCSSS